MPNSSISLNTADSSIEIDATYLLLELDMNKMLSLIFGLMILSVLNVTVKVAVGFVMFAVTIL